MFLGAGAAIWVAGIQLADQTDVLTMRLGLGSTFGGLILLAIATNLPEIAIVAAAAVSGNIGVAVGNILGGIAIQTVVLVVLDARIQTADISGGVVGVGAGGRAGRCSAGYCDRRCPDARNADHSAADARPGADPDGVGAGPGVVATGGPVIALARVGPAPDGQQQPRGHRTAMAEQQAAAEGTSTARAAVIFGFAAAVTLIAGVVLERSGEAIADHIGLSGVLFGATVLAAATSLPELSTGMMSVRHGDYQLAVSDIFGGNAFLPVLFVPATLLSGHAVLPAAQRTDIYLTAGNCVDTHLRGGSSVSPPPAHRPTGGRLAGRRHPVRRWHGRTFYGLEHALTVTRRSAFAPAWSRRGLVIQQRRVATAGVLFRVGFSPG
jgi:cation:H+ antiporter